MFFVEIRKLAKIFLSKVIPYLTHKLTFLIDELISQM